MPSNVRQLLENGTPIYPITERSLVIGLQDAPFEYYVVAWDGASTPVVANIPAGVVVTYNNVNYTGTLAAGSATAPYLYLVASTTQAGEYDRYIVTNNGNNTFTWTPVGSTAPLTPVIVDNLTTNDATKALSAKQGKVLKDELSQFEAKVTDLESGYPTYAWTDTKSVNSVIKEIYLTGLNPNKYYYIWYICKGNNTDELVYLRQVDDTSGKNPVLVVRCVDTNATKGLLRLEPYNDSGVSGYIIKNITSAAAWSATTAYINVPVVTNLDYSPRIKEYLDIQTKNGELDAIELEIQEQGGEIQSVKNAFDAVIIQNINELQGLTPINGKYYQHSDGVLGNGQYVEAYQEKFRIKNGETFYYKHLYAYFCGEMTDGNVWIPFSNDTSQSLDGSFTASADGELRISRNTNVSAIPLLTKSKEMYDNDIYESYYELDQEEIETGATKVFRIGSTRDYTTLRAGIAEAIKYPRSIVYVDAETFDLCSEFAVEIAAAGATNYGILLANDVHIIFESGAVVNALYTGNVENVVKYFSPFHTLGGNGGFTLENLWMYCKNTRYCVHDEYNGADVRTRNFYINCHFEYDGTTSPYNYYQQCIGGGMAKHTYIEIRNCYFKSVGTMTERSIVSWHNCNTANAQSRIVMSNCYFENGTFRLGYHGTTPLISTAFINNCSFTQTPFVRAESAGDSVVNCELQMFLNEIRS